MKPKFDNLFIQALLRKVNECSRKCPSTVYILPALFLMFITWINIIIPSFSDTLSLQYAALIILTAWYSGMIVSFIIIVLSIFSANAFFESSSTWHYDLYFALVFFPVAVLISSLVTGQRKALDKVSKLALYDSLTQLPNRYLLHEQLELIYKMSQRRNYGFGVVFIDVDNFKSINDNFGHLFGDAVLKHVAQNLRGSARGEDVVARYGGDEFVIILNKLDRAEEATQVLQRISDALQSNFQHNEITTTISVSMGLALYPKHGSDVVELLKTADSALYEAKKIQGSSYIIADKILSSYQLFST